MKPLIILTTLALCLTACGVKGPLYFPEKTEQVQNH